MIIDKILDRKDGDPYNPSEFYKDMMLYGGLGVDIARAMDSGTEKDVKNQLCRYIDAGLYNPEIKGYVNSVEWLTVNTRTTEKYNGWEDPAYVDYWGLNDPDPYDPFEGED